MPGFLRSSAGALASSRVVAALAVSVSLLGLVGCGAVSGMTGRSPSPSTSPPLSFPSPSRSPSPSPSSLGTSDPVSYAAAILRGTNDARRARGLTELVASECAWDAALRRASALVGSAQTTHAPLGGVIADCSPAKTAAENLSRATATPAAVIGAWMTSAGHRVNLLDPDLTRIGVACVRDGPAMLCSQVFLGP